MNDTGSLGIPDRSAAGQLRDLFRRGGFDTQTLERRYGCSRPPGREMAAVFEYRTREQSLGNALARLFLLGSGMNRGTLAAVAGEESSALLLELRLLAVEGERVVPNVALMPAGERLFASDAFRLLGGSGAGDFVLPARTHSADFLRHCLLPGRFRRVLDVGCGCAVHALTLSGASGEVIATDVSARAVAYAKFNTVLNGLDNVTCTRGDLFEPVAGERFDLIVSNPPFVVGPGSEFVWRDNALELDEFSGHVAAEGAGHLEDGGIMQLLCECVEVEGEPWQQRLRDWIDGSGCDAWILSSPPVEPAVYAARRLADVEEAGRSEAALDEWVDYLATRKVRAVVPCLLVLRRRQGANWFVLRGLPRDVTPGAGVAVRRAIAACDLLQRVESDEALMDARLRIADEARLRQAFARQDGSWVPTGPVVLELSDGLPFDAAVDLPVMAFLNQLDGRKTLDECIADFCRATKADRGALQGQLLPIVRQLLGHALLAGEEQRSVTPSDR